ncbi:periodic tryptophan protein 2-like protein, putative [Bodo saltans]|uniref:Periodic tryptophan protein 2-like protein, putative n=1 Tax=Bodo saltans TaxID=75058 RepID=A0A0S4J1U6_BODSA|nr:periodic tryptophan protein 2-like protein, putative [Bodo saltans]|eukprot:CUG82325.1 periodic tryptophan protein 2-like protein, putative [Bodo saltans]
MQSNFQLASVLGMLYTGGNVCFSPDGTTLYSPVQNYLAAVNLRGESNKSLQVANSSVQRFDISPDGDLAIVVGTRGLGFFYSISARVVLDTISFPPNCTISAVKFSPCSKFVALGLESTLQIYNAPTQRVVSFHGCHRLENVHMAMTLPITGIDWTSDSQHVLLSGQDARMRIYPRSVQNRKGMAQMQNNLVGHRSAVLSAWFLDDEATTVISVAADNVAIVWNRTEVTRKEILQSIATAQANAKVADIEHRLDRAENGGDDDEEDEGNIAPSFLEKEKLKELLANGVRVSEAVDEHLSPVLRYAFEIKKKFMLQHKGNVSVAAFHKERNLVAIGYTSGIFAIHAAASEAFDLIHMLSITAQSLTACAFSPGGDWVAFGSAHLKQLLVWDWKGESYLLKEQSHYYDISCTAMTSDGASIISGGEDGKVKVWNTATGQCYVTFTEHQGGITGIAASAATNAFFTCSKDGTARGYDLVRYRHFRVFTNAQRMGQNSCISIDPSGEVLAVGSSAHNFITLFSVQTGRVIDELSGHKSPLVCIAFHPSGTVLASGALDNTLIVWDIFNTGDSGDRLKGDGDVIELTSEVLCVAYSHSGKRMAVLCMNHEVSVYDTIIPDEPQLVANFNTSMDAAGGWNGKNVGPNSANANARFTSIAFSPEGDKIVAGGESKWICLYHASQGYVLKKWPVTANLDVQGAEEQYQWRSATEAGNLNDIDVDDDDIHLKQQRLIEMPGSRHRHFATGKRKTELTARTMHISFAGHGSEFVCATTDGLLVFSLYAAKPKFQPLQLSKDVTIASVRQRMADGQLVLALIGALMLKDEILGKEAMRRMPASSIPVATSSVPTAAYPVLVLWVSKEVEESPFLEHSLLWAQHLLVHSNEPLMGPGRDHAAIVPALKQLYRSLQTHKTVETLAQENFFSLEYLLQSAKMHKGKNLLGVSENNNNSTTAVAESA